MLCSAEQCMAHVKHIIKHLIVPDCVDGILDIWMINRYTEICRSIVFCGKIFTAQQVFYTSKIVVFYSDILCIIMVGRVSV